MSDKLILDESIIDVKFENLLKAFIRKVKKEGILEEFKARRYFMKPSLKRHLRNRGNKNVR